MLRTLSLIWTLLLTFGVSHAQEPVRTTPDRQADSSTAEEKTIRAAYAKLEVYNWAAELMAMKGAASKVRDDSVLRYQLRNFRTGPLDEIKLLRISQLVTVPDGDVIRISSGSFSLNDGPWEAYYIAKWWKKPKEVGRRDWTVEELFQLLVTEYFDVGRYTSYEVEVSFEGKTRSYKAIVFHHDQSEHSFEPKLTFWDSIGTDGQLAQVSAEMRPPYGTGPSKILIAPK